MLTGSQQILRHDAFGSNRAREIVVFVKTVFDVRQTSGIKELNREDAMLSVNRADLFAIEMALRVSALLCARVVVCSMGVLSSRSVLERLYALGVDEIDLISDKALKGADTFATAKVLSEYLRVRRPQSCLWCFGAESSDSATSQVGPQVAVQMKSPLVGDVVSIEKASGGSLLFHVSGDVIDANVESKMPLIVIVSTRAAQLRVATVKGVLSARNRKCNVISAKELGLKGACPGLELSKTLVSGIRPTRESPRKPKCIRTGFVPFLFDQIASAGCVQEQSLAFRARCDPANSRCFLVSDFCRGEEEVSECRKIAAHYYAAGGRSLALYAIGAKGRHELSATGIPSLYQCSRHCDCCYDAVSCGRCVSEFLKVMRPQVVLFRASSQMRRTAPVIAALLESGLAADCISFTLNPDVCFERPTFGESRLAQIKCCKCDFEMATLRGGRFGGSEFLCECPDYLLLRRDRYRKSCLRMDILERHDDSLWNHDVVLVAGAGVRRESVDHLRWIARTLNADFGATRPLVDKGWVEHRYQVGQTGAAISHPLYVSFGVSGELEHRIAIGQTTKICAINTDPSCSMAVFCDYFIQADANEIILDIKREIEKGVSL